MRRSVPASVLVAAAAALVACGGDDGGELSSEPVADDPDAVVVAENMAFDPDRLSVPAREPVTIVIDNRDEGANHNIHVEGAPEPDRTPLQRGVSQQALTVMLEPGEYDFVCDIHPNMTGTLTAD
ncbi:MAG TPA: cupredoxin domain-containing protein [Acidimicrobiales bacterium]